MTATRMAARNGRNGDGEHQRDKLRGERTHSLLLLVVCASRARMGSTDNGQP
jgi:hypothetical protein